MFRTIGDLDVHYEEQGEGHPLVLVHGTGADTFSWTEMLPRLAVSFRTIALDLRGFGQTRRPAAPLLSHDVWRDDLRRFIETLGRGRVALAGWSLGGTVALNVAVHHPDLVSHLVTLGSASPRVALSDRGGFAERIRLAQAGEPIETIIDKTFEFTASALSPVVRRTNPRAEQLTRALLLRNRPEWYAEAVAANARRPEIGARLGEIACPALIIVGDADTRNGAEHAQDLTKAIPGAYMKVIEDCGHFYGFEQPAATARAMIRFLAAFA
jgi:2-hydroxy-6-oxonona-2,4-dienedioate hydrolase